MTQPPFIDGTDKRALIYEIQNMLYYISFSDEKIPRVNPDGIYGAETKRAVEAFQSKNGLTPTGEVDERTYTSLYDAYSALSYMHSPALPLYAFPGNDYSIEPGEKSDIVLISQIVINNLSYHFSTPSVEMSGEMTEQTQQAVKKLQGLYRLPITGIIDKRTWDAMSGDYSRLEGKNE